jgi:hypothetical protein
MIPRAVLTAWRNQCCPPPRPPASAASPRGPLVGFPLNERAFFADASKKGAFDRITGRTRHASDIGPRLRPPYTVQALRPLVAQVWQ